MIDVCRCEGTIKRRIIGTGKFLPSVMPHVRFADWLTTPLVDPLIQQRIDYCAAVITGRIAGLACPSVCPSVCLSVCLTRTSNSKTRWRRKRKLDVNLSLGRSYRCANFQFKGSKMKVIGRRKSPVHNNNNNNNRLIRRCQNATCYNDMDRTVNKHELMRVSPRANVHLQLVDRPAHRALCSGRVRLTTLGGRPHNMSPLSRLCLFTPRSRGVEV